MSIYLDTSAIVPLLVPEAASERMDAWLSVNEAASLAISPWVDAELSSALSLKVRTGELTVEQRADALAEWRRLREGLVILPVEQDMFAAAAECAARHDLALRAGDALHIAVAAAHGCALLTLDDRMAKASPQLGVPVAAV